MSRAKVATMLVGGAITFNGWAIPVQAAAPQCFGKRATIVGTGRADHLIGTPRADVIVGLAGRGDVIKGRGGNDLICGNEGQDRIFGGNGNDKIKGENGLDTLFGQKGSDLLKTGGNLYGYCFTPDIANGGGGADTLIGTTGIEQLSGGRGKDLVEGRGAAYDDDDCSTFRADLLLGGEDDDSIVGGQAYGSNVAGEVFNGGPGDDMLDGGSDVGERSLNEVFHSDAVSFASAPGPVNVDLELGTAQGQGNDTLIGISSAFGSAFGDTLSGNDGSNWLRGGGGDDTLAGRAGDDFLGGYSGNTLPSVDYWRIGDSGNDLMDGGSGRDRFIGIEISGGIFGPKDEGDDSYIGGEDIDHLTFDCNCSLDRALTVDLAAGIATGWGIDSVAGLENVTGGYGGDILLGDPTNNILSGGGGNDTLEGASGHDALFGGDGDDSLDGSAGTNSNDGGAGSDTCQNPNTAGGALNCES